MNVVLSGVSRAGGCVTADVTPRLANRALFDHPYDHIPALVLTEAARQLAVASFGGSAAEAVLTGVNAGFGRHAELDQPLTAAARMAPVATAGASGDPAGRLPAVVTVTFAQGPAPAVGHQRARGDVARVTLDFTRNGA